MQLLSSSHRIATPAVGELTAARREGSRIAVTTSLGQPLDLPVVWLRDNCPCNKCRIDATGEHRYFLGRSAELPDATEISLDNGVLCIDWTDGHRSEFSDTDLARLLNIASRSHISAEPWSDDYEPARFDREAVLNDVETRVEFFATAMRDGMALVTEMPNESGECIRFLEELKLPVRDTPFDRLHDVFFRSDGYNVAHTDEALPPHNDFASYTWPPSGQLIHMLINEVSGGDWVNVDGFKVVAKLWQTHPEAVQTLARVPVAFREHADYAESWTRAPIVRIDGRGNVIGIRFSNQLMQPMSPLDPDVEAFYEAYYLLSRAVNDPVNQIEFRGHAGTMQFVHGHRILHARRAFDSGSGERHLQDTYFDFDDVASLHALTAGTAR